MLSVARRSLPTLAASRTARHAATVAARRSAAIAIAASTAPSRSSLLPSSSRHFRAVVPRAVRAKPPPATASTPAATSKPQTDSGAPGPDLMNDGEGEEDEEKLTGTEWRDLVHLAPSDQAELINSLPMFRHTCTGVHHFTWATSSTSCADRLHPEESGSWWDSLSGRVKSVAVEAKILMELSNYVAVADRPYDTWKGVQQAHEILFALFNTFHLAQSRAQLRTLCTPQVYEAVDASWRALDKYGLRLIYRSAVHNIQMLDLHIHDTDEWEPLGPSNGGGGGGGMKIPATGPLGVHPAGVPGQQASTAPVPPASSSTQRMASVPPKKDPRPDSPGSSSSTRDRTPVRYADLDVQVDVAETFELWSTRPDQKLEEDSFVDLTTDAAKSAAAAVPPSSASSDTKIVADFESRLNSLDQQAQEASAGAQLHRVLAAIDGTNTFNSPEATVATAGTPTPEAPKATADPSAPAAPAAPAAPSADATAAPAAAPASSSSSSSSATPPPPSTPTPTPATPAAAATPVTPKPSTPATPATAPDADWAPPLICLSTISGHGERGLRFWTPLPPRNMDDRGKFIVPSVVSSVIFESNSGSSSSVQMMEKWLKEQLAIAKHPDALKAPKPNWIIKDILD